MCRYTARMDIDDLLTVEEVAARFRLSKATIRRWTREGKLPVHRMSTQTIRYLRADVERVIKESKAKPPTTAPRSSTAASR